MKHNDPMSNIALTGPGGRRKLKEVVKKIAQQDYLRIYASDGIDTLENDNEAKAKIIELYNKGLLVDALIVQDEKSFAKIITAYGNGTAESPLYVTFHNGGEMQQLELVVSE